MTGLGAVELAALLVFLLCGGYLIVLIVSAWMEVRTLPREEMYWCERHGALRMDATIIFDEQHVCPICFHERLNNAERMAR